MARLDLYKTQSGIIVLDVQAPLLDHLNTRAVLPLRPRTDIPKPMSGLNPEFEIDGQI